MHTIYQLHEIPLFFNSNLATLISFSNSINACGQSENCINPIMTLVAAYIAKHNNATIGAYVIKMCNIISCDPFSTTSDDDEDANIGRIVS